MEFTAQQIAALLNGRVEGNAGAVINSLSKIEEAQQGSVTFLANPKYEPFIYTTGASVAVVNKDFAPSKKLSVTLIRVEDAYKAFAQLLEHYSKSINDKKGIEQHSHVSPSAKTGRDVYIGSFAYIGDHAVIGNNVKIYPLAYIGDHARIGDNTVIHPGVKIYHDSIIGAHCILHSGVIIGADGFGFAPNTSGNYQKVAQTGNVVIEDHVEIGAGTTIDRATLGSTYIRKGVKLDNLIQIAHNCDIGENTVIAAQTGIAGSTKIGKECMIGGQVGIVGHITIAERVKIAAQSGIGSSIETPGEIVQGSPAFTHSDYKRTYVVFKKLPELEKRILELEKILSELKQTAS
jgi:UDP-3-O-[3-hydroxymyristoyl] glucosamine N-acyltransferase